MQKLFQKLHNRALPFLLAVLMLASSLPLNVLSIGADTATDGTANGTPSPDGYIYDYDTLKITKDGKETYAMDLLTHEKITISADGLTEDATYQWQIRHNENDNTWINIYDATEKELPVTLALLGNLLRDDNTAMLRCRAYTDTYAYLTSPITVTVKEPTHTTITTPTQTTKDPSFKAGAEDVEFVTVTVQYVRYDFDRNDQGELIIDGEGNYVYNDGAEAFSSYIATLKKGNTLDTTVKFPVLVGYDAFWEAETVSSTFKKFDNQTVNESVVYTVSYKPALVDYSIRYFFQNIYDDKYVEDPNLKSELTDKGYTGAQPPAAQLSPSVDGFTPLFHQPDFISADGSTAFEVYFERNYYLMEFDCDGGYGTETLYVRYGSYIAVPDPVRSGHTFEFWDLVRVEDSDGTVVNKKDGVETVDDKLPSTMPAHNSAYIAVWGVSDTIYTVVYWAENADDDEYSYWGSQTFKTVSGEKRAGNKYGSYTDTLVKEDVANITAVSKYFDYDASLSDKEITIEGDGSTVINVYYTRRAYKLRFYYARTSDGTLYQIATSTDGSSNSNKITQASWNGSYSEPSLNADGLAAINGHYATQGQELVSGYYYLYFEFTAKYNADLSTCWPSAWINAYDSGTGMKFVSWGTEKGSGYYNNNSNKNIKGTFQRLDENLIIDPTETADTGKINHRLVAYWNSNPKPWTYYIYFTTLPGESVSEIRNGIEYTLKKTDTLSSTDPNASGQSKLSFEGVTLTEGPVGSNYEVSLYYERNQHTFSFYNYNSAMDGKNQTLVFGMPLSEYRISDSDMQTLYYPKGVEPGSLEFAGWYTSAGCYDGTEVDWSADTMPDNDVTLYAKWTPVVRTVTFYSAYSDIKKDEDDLSDTIYHFMHADNVLHGTNLGSAYLYIPDHPADKTLAPATSSDADLTDYNESLKYDFVGWFYMDENNKKRFAPDSMEVTRDLVLFAEWQTSIDTTYEIKYVLAEDVGAENTLDDKAYPKGTEVATLLFAHSSVGKTKSFEAKAGTALNPAFRSHFFPKTNSHSILMEADASKNTYSFEYVYDDNVFYKIRYLEQGTNKVLHEAVEKSTENAIITEKFLPIKDYLPTSYYLTRALQYDGNATTAIEENTFTFYYVKDDKNGLYSIEYYWENADSTDAFNKDNYSLYESTVGKAPLDNPRVSADDRSETYAKFGFVPVATMNTVITYNEDGTVKAETPGDSGNVEYTGLTIKVYFRRKAVDYTVQYVEYGGDVLYSTEFKAEMPSGSNNWTPKIGSTVTATAPDSYKKDGVTYYFYATDGKEQTQNLTLRQNASANVITFYFKLREYTIFYEARSTVDGLTDFGFASPNMDYVSRTTDIGGSTATALKGFKFVEWRNAAGQKVCTDAYWKPTDFSGANAEYEIYYYAYFEPIYTTLTVNNQASSSSTDTFLFRVEGNGKVSYIDTVISIQGTGSVTIEGVPVGSYTITELTDWSWENTVASGNESQTIDVESTTTVTFTNTPDPSNWLNGETVNENQFNP